MDNVAAVGTKQEQQAFKEVSWHYDMANQDLVKRMIDWDKKDTLFRSHINESSWPYRAQVFDPRVFTVLYEKTARILANKPQGRLIPREGGDALGAKINNELLMFQWDDNERVESLPMLAKWALMDQNARKYGASFGLATWRWQRQVRRETPFLADEAQPKGKSTVWYDGPDFRPLNNRDCLPNPSYSTIKNWFQVRDYLTLAELQDTNDAARSKPIYKNLDLLRTQLANNPGSSGDLRATNYSVKNLTLKGLSDQLGMDPYNKVIEIVTEYRPDRWVTFSPKHGVVLRDIPNPYDHGQIPIVQLKYYPIDEDLYGLSEIEPVEKLQKAINALLCQYLDSINMGLYRPLMVKATGVQMHTLEFGPAKKWIMNEPGKDVVAFDQGDSGIAEFTNTYRFLVAALQEALGETSAIVSNQAPGSGDKTATEVKDLAISRSARDNYNLIYLGEALKKQMMFWLKMNQQFLFSSKADQKKIIQITGKDSIKFFQGEGLDGMGLDDQSMQMMSDPNLAGSIKPEDMMSPIYPVKVGNDTLPKLTVEDNGSVGHLIIEPEDLAGTYDYIPDVGSMNQLATEEEIKAKGEFLQYATGVDPKTGQPSGLAAAMQQEGKKFKATELAISYAELIGFKDADQYIESSKQPMNGGVPNDQVNGGGAGAQIAGGVGMGAVGDQGMAGGPMPMANGQAGPNVSQPAGFPG